MSFKGKNMIVTGATGDLGTAITQRLISQGANVLAVGSRAEEFPRLMAACSGPGLLETIVADVSDSKQVLEYAKRAFDLWGQIDGFVNNAGIQTPVHPIVDFPEEDFDRVMAVNVRGMFLGLKHVLPRMREGGSVVNMSSALGLVGGAGNLRLRRVQARHHRPDQNRRARTGASQGACQCLLSRSHRWNNDIQAGRRGVRGQQ